MTYTFIVYGIGAITLTLYNIVAQDSFIGYPADHWWIFIALAIFPTFLGHSLLNWALRWLCTATISMCIVFDAIGANALASFLLGVKVTATQRHRGMIVLF